MLRRFRKKTTPAPAVTVEEQLDRLFLFMADSIGSQGDRFSQEGEDVLFFLQDGTRRYIDRYRNRRSMLDMEIDEHTGYLSRIIIRSIQQTKLLRQHDLPAHRTIIFVLRLDNRIAFSIIENLYRNNFPPPAVREKAFLLEQ